MENIVVPVSALLKLAKELEADGMEYVQLSILDPDDDEGEITNYEKIEHVPDFD